jgi:hypothetical protein
MTISVREPGMPISITWKGAVTDLATAEDEKSHGS